MVNATHITEEVRFESEEEIKDILRMAGEEIKVDTTQDSEK